MFLVCRFTQTKRITSPWFGLSSERKSNPNKNKHMRMKMETTEDSVAQSIRHKRFFGAHFV
jgi:hypothetical protein